jgi:hypothetical protein
MGNVKGGKLEEYASDFDQRISSPLIFCFLED